ncbi:hypothetical protein GCM10009844_16330 [Nocardioides koreensis]|uniref:Uncharacterized protein n=1 Tax=Nocardioides koreensis TaxID=433651 RepID=A0ABP5LE04_9ACTN
MGEPAAAFYARRGNAVSDWWTLLHPPYTAWHLSYVALGAAVAPALDWTDLAFTLLAFFLAVGLAAHALDEQQGRPLRTGIASTTLSAVAALSLLGAVVLGLAGAFFRDGANWALLAAIPVGAVLVVGYNLELFGGRLHNDHVFAWGWGGFPVVVGFLAQAPTPAPGAVAAAAAMTLAAVGTSYAQRRLSTPARRLRRDTVSITGDLTTTDGTAVPLDRAVLLSPLEGALRAMSWAVPMTALAVLLASSSRG